MGFDPEPAIRIVAEAIEGPVTLVEPGDVIGIGQT
jgi:hypothetical protein